MNDFKDTLFKALDILGCDPARFSFDAQSPIVMSFSDVEDVVLEPTPDEIAVWGMLPDFSNVGAVHGVQDLLAELASPVDFLTTGYYTVRTGGEQRFHVGGALRNECSDSPQVLATAIESFHARLGQLRERLR
jgi:hypothetical protein